VEEVDAEDEVESAQVDVDAGDGVLVACDGDGHVARNPSAPKAIPIDHGDPQLVAAKRGEAESGHHGALQKIMGGAGVEESQEARALEHHGHDHRVLRTDAHECMERPRMQWPQ
jgi:hypothetical protein